MVPSGTWVLVVTVTGCAEIISRGWRGREKDRPHAAAEVDGGKHAWLGRVGLGLAGLADLSVDLEEMVGYSIFRAHGRRIGGQTYRRRGKR